MQLIKHKCGFTLLEGLVVMVILVIFTGMATVMLLNIKSNEISGVQSEFLSILSLAHNEAVTRSVPTVIEARSPIAGNEFAGGWRLGVDTNNNGTIDSNEIIIRSRAALSKNINFGSGKNLISQQVNRIQFDSKGYLLASSPIQLKICIKDSNSQDGYQFIVNNNGLSNVKNNISCK